MAQPKKYLNYLKLNEPAVGNERRYEMLGEILKKGTFTPRPVLLSDIDDAVTEWVQNSLKISYNDKILPTMVLYSNQRFTEYSQTWQYTDENKNLILNFKTVTRENNPEYGHIQGGLWNVPGDRFYHMKRTIVLDDNGSESFLDLEMRQPMAIDLMYRVSIFTTHLQVINDFNTIVNDHFKARQDYICPNGHYMPMVLDGISDRSSYEINDRQFYSQVFSIKVNGYIIKEDDYRIKEWPLKIGAKILGMGRKSKYATIEIDEDYVNPCNKPKEEEKTYYKPVYITIMFPECVRKTEFELDTDFVFESDELDNVRSYEIILNDDQPVKFGTKINRGDRVSVSALKLISKKEATLRLVGYDPNVVYETKNDISEVDADNVNTGTEYVVEV